ncbi:dihydrofolate reductase [Kribbella pittospori]|uniref:Dihydrofolate reductase n=1 Tax=Kribbella pittospori TaxID=722689 RepID=A0A4R0K9L7_9ACTN|nr:dihydrofolate reductase family protein [Kribbella pittospori]TCC56399.1 dihydrofolate reductase [Kribbella pittospori]
MARVRVHNFTITLDGIAAGPGQRLDAPFGDGMDKVHDWMEVAQADRAAGKSGLGADRIDGYAEGVGATIMGRNMFGPQRGAWEDESWTGWWGDNPPYHHDTFVLTHHLRPSIPMEGGTTFHFTDEPIEAVLERALKAAGGRDVVIAGGAHTVQQYLRAGLIDELNLVIAPILAGSGEHLFDDVANALGAFQVTEMVSDPSATFVRLERQ